MRQEKKKGAGGNDARKSDGLYVSGPLKSSTLWPGGSREKSGA